MKSLVIKRLGCYVWHGVTWTASQFPLILPSDLYANGRLSLHWHWQGHQSPTPILSVGGKTTQWETQCVNYKAICTVTHTTSKEEILHTWLPLTSSLPGHFASDPRSQAGSGSVLGGDRSGTTKLCPSRLCCWHDMGPIVRAEEYYHTI